LSHRRGGAEHADSRSQCNDFPHDLSSWCCYSVPFERMTSKIGSEHRIAWMAAVACSTCLGKRQSCRERRGRSSVVSGQPNRPLVAQLALESSGTTATTLRKEMSWQHHTWTVGSTG